MLLENSFFWMTLFNQDISDFKIFGLNVFNFSSVISSPVAFILSLSMLYKEIVSNNKLFFTLIIAYVIYQLVVVLPLTLYYYPNLLINTYTSNLTIRLTFLFIPFFYWLLVRYKSYNFIFFLFNIFAIILFVAKIYDYTQGFFSFTNTGEIRIVGGMESIYFMILLTYGLKHFGSDKTRYLPLIIATVGMILTNHRSVFLSIAGLYVISILIVEKAGVWKRKLISVVLILFVLLVFANYSSFMDTFVSRAKTSFDTNDENYNDRFLKNILAYENFLDNPINGTLLSGDYYKVSAVSNGANWRPHNFIFEVLASQGIVGILFIFFFLYLIIKLGLKNRSDKITLKSLYILIFYVFIALTNTTFFHQATFIILMMFCAIILARNRELVIEKNPELSLLLNSNELHYNEGKYLS